MQIHTSRQAGGIASSWMRSTTSGSSMRPPAGSRYSKTRPLPRRTIPGAAQLDLRSRGTALPYPLRGFPISAPGSARLLPVHGYIPNKIPAHGGMWWGDRTLSGGPVIANGGQTASDEEIGVLLVEDDEGDARLVEDELSEVLPRARIVRSRMLQEALSELGPAIDCVLLDLGLPDASGLDAVARLRARMPAIPLIVLTGLADEAAGVAAVQAGAQDYLIKGNVDGNQLVRSIRYSIGRRQADEAERELLLGVAQGRGVT